MLAKHAKAPTSGSSSRRLYRHTFVGSQVVLQEVCLAALAVIHGLRLPAHHGLRHTLVHKDAGVLIQPCVCNELLQQGPQGQRKQPERFQVPTEGDKMSSDHPT